MVFSDGKLVARDGELLAPAATGKTPSLGRCDVAWDFVRLDLPARSDRIRVIGSRPDQLTTDHRVLPNKSVRGQAVCDLETDLLKIAVIERHQHKQRMGVGFIQGFGLHRGAIAGTVAHDHHNLITIGSDDISMLSAAHAAAEGGGGLAVAVGQHVVARLPLPIGGLMSDRPIGEVAANYQKLLTATQELGSTLKDPFMAMSFMGLEVIPSLKLTDHGLIDVDRFQIVDLFV
jgi:adenine deaminase